MSKPFYFPGIPGESVLQVRHGGGSLKKFFVVDDGILNPRSKKNIMVCRRRHLLRN